LDVGLGDRAEVDAMLMQLGQERLSLGELTGDVLLRGSAQRPDGGVGAQPGQLMPRREPA
jgi:hypothetical protein